MVSQLAWLDHDDAQMRRALTVIELLKEESTVDEIGIGPIRDTIADVLFPGTSVLHTRARYLLFVPWLLERTAKLDLPPDRAVAELRRLETQLIHALLAGRETEGVIGGQAHDRLRRMPSAAYWAATLRYGIRTWDTSVEGYLRRSRGVAALRRVEPEADDLGVLADDRRSGVDADLPAIPDHVLQYTTFELTAAEADYLRDRLLASTRGSMLAWLLQHRAPLPDGAIWHHPSAGVFPTQLAQAVDHGRRLHIVLHGAALLYNLLLAEQLPSDELLDGYRADLDQWSDDVAAEGALDSWDRHDLWAFLLDRNPRLRPATRAFVDNWVDGIARNPADVADSEIPRELIRTREWQLKGTRSRLKNRAALDNWNGGSGLARLDYRWPVARRLLRDIAAGTGEAI